MVNCLIYRIGFGWTMPTVSFIILLGLVLAAAMIRSNRAHEPNPFKLRTYITPLKDKKFVFLCASTTLFGFGLFLPFNFIPLAAQSLGMSVELSVYSVNPLHAASVFGRVIPGMLGEKFGRFNLMMIGTSISAILTLALLLPGSNNAASLWKGGITSYGEGLGYCAEPTRIVPRSIGS